MRRTRFSLRTMLLAVVVFAVVAVMVRIGWNRIDPPQIRHLRQNGLPPLHYTMVDGDVRFLYFSSRAEFSDLSPLANLKKLEVLYLNHADVKDLTPLHEIDNLRVVGLKGPQVTDEQVRRLQESFPGCEIRR